MPKVNKTATISPTTFIDRLVKKNELGQPFTLMGHQHRLAPTSVTPLFFLCSVLGWKCGQRTLGEPHGEAPGVPGA
jgi:hypothetical protein